jgi:hypothetical protein
MLALSLALLLLPAVSFSDDIDLAKKYTTHSQLLYKYTSYVTWPKLVVEGDIKNIDLCIIGDDTLQRIDDLASRALQNKEVKINIRRNAESGDLTSCNIAYISISKQDDYQNYIAKMAGFPILTVSEIPDFQKNGGIIGLQLKGTKVSFAVNLKNAETSNLKISADMLEGVEVIR